MLAPGGGLTDRSVIAERRAFRGFKGGPVEDLGIVERTLSRNPGPYGLWLAGPRGDDRVNAAIAQYSYAIERAELTLGNDRERSEEHTSELQSLMRISYAVFCLKKKKQNII